MTTETATEETEAEAPNSAAEFQLPPDILDIFQYLSCNDKIVFKSQQIDDPELQRNEKAKIAQDIFEHNRQTFLSRFGGYLEKHHLTTFAQLATSATPLKADENGDEIQLLLLDYQHKLQTRKQDVKNRRYTAMQQLIVKGEYFSELEMMQRAPELYQDLIGQYLSESERKERDSYDVKNTCFSGILMHTMQRREMDDVLEKADEQNRRKEYTTVKEVGTDSIVEFDGSPEEEVPEQSTSADAFDVPASFRQQWGNFDNEQIACSTSRIPKHAPETNKKLVHPGRHKRPAAEFITAGERELLRQEFVGLMHEQFLAGLDENFDYTQVDDNVQLDDLQQLNQDREDAYFEASDEDEDGAGERHKPQAQIESIDEESDDELDIYMSHLNQHPSLHEIK